MGTPHWVEQVRMRLIMLFHRSRAAAGLDQELRDHVEHQIQENMIAGMNAEEARYAALRSFGNPTLLRDQARAAWNWAWVESLLRDVRYAFRALRRTPGFASIAAVVMALGIGANVALFTVVRGVILKPLPFQDPGRLLMLYENKLHEEDAGDYNVVAGGIYAEWKKQNHTFESIALERGSRVGLSGSSGQLAEKLCSGQFSWDLLPTLGVHPALGRNFTREDDSPAASGTVLLSWQLWKRRFGGDPGILNHQIYVDARPVTWFSQSRRTNKREISPITAKLPAYHYERNYSLIKKLDRSSQTNANFYVAIRANIGSGLGCIRRAVKQEASNCFKDVNR